MPDMSKSVHAAQKLPTIYLKLVLSCQHLQLESWKCREHIW